MKLEDLLADAGVETADQVGSLHARSGWLNVRCPFCGSNKYLLGLTSTTANCYQCGPKTVYDALSVLCPNLSKRELVHFLRNVKPTKFYRGVKVRGTYKPPPGRISLMDSPFHKRYVESRNLDPKLLESFWKVEAIPQVGNHAWRLFIPVFWRYEPVSWTTRAVADGLLRYKSADPKSESLPHKSILFGEDFAGDTIVIVEGPMDVFTLGPGTVCTFGLNWSAEQLDRMILYPRRYVCFNNEPQAQRRAQKLVDILTPFPGQTWNVILDEKDINAMPPRKVKKLRNKVFGE